MYGRLQFKGRFNASTGSPLHIYMPTCAITHRPSSPPVSKNPNIGTVRQTIAIHRCHASPYLITARWAVGHRITDTDADTDTDTDIILKPDLRATTTEATIQYNHIPCNLLITRGMAMVTVTIEPPMAMGITDTDSDGSGLCLSVTQDFGRR